MRRSLVLLAALMASLLQAQATMPVAAADGQLIERSSELRVDSGTLDPGRSRPDEHEGHGAGTHTMPAAPPGADELATAIADVPSNFDKAAWLRSGDQPGTDNDVVGAFRLICNITSYGYVDPLVYPGVKDKSRIHLHAFFGNTEVDENSTYDSLRTHGDGSCHGGPLNRSGYWMPAMLDGRGNAVNPGHVTLYYKRLPKDSPGCRTQARACVDLPRGLKAVFGNNYVKGESQSPHVRYDCDGQAISELLGPVAARCKAGQRIYLRIEAPDCWDGRRVASPDHQAHLAYQTYDRRTGRPSCPASHPYMIVKLSMIASWLVQPGDDPTRWAFSSDVMMGRPAGSTAHADYMEAWDDTIRTAWHANCIDRKLSCSDGALGNGVQLKRAQAFAYEQEPRLVRVP